MALHAISYFEDRQKAYVDFNNIAIARQKVSVGQVSFGPEGSCRIRASDGSIIEPLAGILGIWDFDKSDVAVNGVPTSSSDIIKRAAPR